MDITLHFLLFVKVVDAIESILQHIPPLFKDHNVSTIVLLFGSTILNPKELYKIHFHYDSTSPTHKEATSDKVIGDYVRKTIRTIVMNQLDAFGNDLGMPSSTCSHSN
jgi:hypothetical protein